MYISKSVDCSDALPAGFLEEGGAVVNRNYGYLGNPK